MSIKERHKKLAAVRHEILKDMFFLTNGGVKAVAVGVIKKQPFF